LHGIKEEVKKNIDDMPLNELRNARGLSQKMIAEALHIQQPAIAKMEKRTGTYIPCL
jgi:predicted XRE-type DNA-binding protein